MNDPKTALKIGAVLFPGFELLDVYGPLEMFALLPTPGEITLIGPQPGTVPSNAGPASLAVVALADIRAWDVLLIPGGLGTRRVIEDGGFLHAVRRQAEASRIVATVCTGSALLARTGLLDGKRATSNKRAFSWVVAQGPNVNWVREARWVVDDKFYTSSGVSAGMDMALALIAKLHDPATSESVATRAEYDWHRDPRWDPFARANGLV